MHLVCAVVVREVNISCEMRLAYTRVKFGMDFVPAAIIAAAAVEAFSKSKPPPPPPTPPSSPVRVAMASAVFSLSAFLFSPVERTITVVSDTVVSPSPPLPLPLSVLSAFTTCFSSDAASASMERDFAWRQCRPSTHTPRVTSLVGRLRYLAPPMYEQYERRVYNTTPSSSRNNISNSTEIKQTDV